MITTLLSDSVCCHENTEQFNLLKNYVNEAREKLVQRREKKDLNVDS